MTTICLWVTEYDFYMFMVTEYDYYMFMGN